MAAVLEGLIPSRRRPSRSRSESGKQLHARWGDAAITAPNGGGWSQQYLEDDLNNPIYQAHGSPDSQKTLVNNSPDLSYEQDKIEKISIEEIRQPTPPVVSKERNAITITIPLPWSRKIHRRSSSGSTQQTQVVQQVEKLVTAEPRPALTNITTNIDEVIVAESRPVADPFRSGSPIVHTQSPVYDDVSTFFTRAAFPDKGYGPGHLPHIQTNVQQAKSQPASAISVLSPVAEKYNGLSESNNATPLDNTPIAAHVAAAIPTLPSASEDDVINVDNLAARLENQVRTSPPVNPPSRITSPIEASDSDLDRPYSRSNSQLPSRPSSRGPGIGEVAYMRASSRGPTDQRRSASREPVSRRAESVEPFRRRARSREPVGSRSESRDTEVPARSFSRDPIARRAGSCEPVRRRAESPPPRATCRAISREPAIHRTVSPDRATRRTHSRAPFTRRTVSPGPMTRRAISRDPVTRRRISVDLTRRAASVDPIRRRASPRDDIIPRRGTPRAIPRGNMDSSDSSSADDLTSADETTDIETETDEMYFESRKGWNGAAVAGANSKGFYGDVVQDYKAIARDVEADIVQGAQAAEVPMATSNTTGLVNKKDKDKESKVYSGPDLVPSNEELWG
ncbi:uncharacterized protein Z518_02210 [Rhinocladiella mackenziei CBS 650.93]|uniref:Uncharacterized protein n=1 Tax=Rhinocladiella mackenziei CBS 650.93 TaxID=1442369 RepID=A0A0D2FZ69_9EURO|nr:uncharacterized protein Z518_02210 [Rhinocladiella mackenziei CBS 650.93]KIX07557.1 hypothetical protein Z518_02210 [Rhinocladiella mackenziei CBS 650.93]